jgi:two-component SAPR family response regulator
MNRGPLVLVDDDAEDQELLLLVLQELGFPHEIKTFKSADAALQFLYNSDERPFLIVSDVNMPKMDGIAFKRTIEKCDILGPKRIPFIFLSTSTRFVNDAAKLNIQGYFEKGNSMRDLHETVKTILSYWTKTRHLN